MLETLEMAAVILPMDLSSWGDIAPSIADMPGQELWKKMASWALALGFLGCLISLAYGGGIWGLGYLGETNRGSSKGRPFVFGGLAGAIVLGLSFDAINGLAAL